MLFLLNVFGLSKVQILGMGRIFSCPQLVSFYIGVSDVCFSVASSMVLYKKEKIEEWERFRSILNDCHLMFSPGLPSIFWGLIHETDLL